MNIKRENIKRVYLIGRQIIFILKNIDDLVRINYTYYNGDIAKDKIISFVKQYDLYRVPDSDICEYVIR